MIPAAIHFVWTGMPGQKAPPMPDWAKANVAEFRRLNRRHKVRMHGEEVLLPEYRSLYDAATSFAHTSDLLRYSALQRYGGWYFDLDVWPFRPVRDIERAYALDGRRLFVCEQHGQMDRSLTRNGAIMAAGAKCMTWEAINESLAALPMPPHRIATGPGLLTRLATERPEIFEVGAWPWFYPAEIGRAGRIYRMLRSGRDGAVARSIAPTGGQLPFAMHLWACEKGTLPEGEPAGHLGHYDGQKGPYKGQRVFMAPNTYQWQESKVCAEPFHAIAEGLARIGFDVDVYTRDEEASLREAGLYNLAVLWNGRHAQDGRFAAQLREQAMRTLIFELGFFDRNRYWQCDHRGILHWASWADELDKMAPRQGAERLAKVWPGGLLPFPRRRKGYVLVLGQVHGDSQMDESEIASSTVLERMVAQTLAGRGTPGRFRPHPKAQVVRKEYLPRGGEGQSLQDAVAGAKFVVTINSNAGNEALALGCPVLCMGPALYERAGVAKRTSRQTFADDLEVMLEGWRPNDEHVENYLRWLASRQWCAEEWRDGRPLKMLVERAGL